mmetsp:Transcript_40115/g.74139  ORF Transcript_40115/g.74139 Transcript_40115/m.74139 type:complete len:244 (+) Transcript_40115:255-986(+)
MDAAATGSGDRLERRAFRSDSFGQYPPPPMPLPTSSFNVPTTHRSLSSSLMILRASSVSNGSMSSCSFDNAAASDGGTTSGRDASACPNLTYVGPKRSRPDATRAAFVFALVLPGESSARMISSSSSRATDEEGDDDQKSSHVGGLFDSVLAAANRAADDRIGSATSKMATEAISAARPTTTLTVAGTSSSNCSSLDEEEAAVAVAVVVRPSFSSSASIASESEAESRISESDAKTSDEEAAE